ncbi:MAG: serine--tRNA ligase [Armatimonadetes bacterium]|nr:MAG: serine--tRNA ligase [Armatimonadota bacterium]
MIDITILRTQRDALAASLARRGVDVDLDALTDLDERRRGVRVRAEEVRANQKAAGKAIATLTGDGKAAAIADASQLAEDYKVLIAEADSLDEEFNAAWVLLPNMTDPTAADGLEEEDAVEISKVGTPRKFDFEAKDHVELGTALGVLDVERASKVSGSRFGFIMGDLAILEFALVRYAMDMVMPHGFKPMIPPVLVRDHALYGTGFFPGDAEQVYAVTDDDLFLVGTSEVPIAAFHADEIFDEDELPVRYAGYSTCFRREAGTYGKDTRGIFRVHQFDKVEMFSFVRPEDSTAEHEFLLAREEELLGGLELPYRVVNVAAGDLGSSAAKKYDIEAWFPSQDRYREVTSTSNTTDYQSRRLKIRYRSESGNELVHTLNGTAIAVGRILIALMENHQNADGSVQIPEALVRYAGFEQLTSG